MAAPYVENGGHQGIPYLASMFTWQGGLCGSGDLSLLSATDQFPGLYLPDSFDDSPDTFTSQQAILNQNDNNLLSNFFKNPEEATAEIFSDWRGVDHRVNTGIMGGQMDGLDEGSQVMQDPTATLANAASSLTQAHMGESSGHMASHINFDGNELGRGSEDDFKAASGLVGMSLHGQSNSRTLTHSQGIMAGQWDYYPEAGAFNNNVHMQDNITSPITSSGRQSANSYHSQPQTAYMNNHFPDSFANQQLMQQLSWMQGTQQHMPQNVPRARPASLQYDANELNYMPTNPQQGNLSHSSMQYGHGGIRPSAPIRFGSDDQFGRAGYRGAHNSISLEEEKQGNLINVPLAAQAAANGHSHVQPHVPYMAQQLQHSHSAVAGSSRHVHSMSAASSPGAHLGGIPLHTPSFNAHMPGNLYHAALPQRVEEEEYDDSDDERGFPEEQARKRRKSQMERDDDADYYPSGHAMVPMAKREAKPSRNVTMQDSDEEYATPAKSTFRKRRKSSMVGVRPSVDSSNGNSPSSKYSPMSKPTAASSKKKGRDTEPRKNLTEDQKRKNHIHSEKQRRDLIKVQYDALDNLVPALKGGKSGLSRSDVLQEIVAYVENIMTGNAEMERVLEEMRGLGVAAVSHVDHADEIA